MRKVVFFAPILILVAMVLLACGGGHKDSPVVVTTNAFSFIQEVPNQGATFTPMLGQYVNDSQGLQFQGVAATDYVTGGALTAGFGSLYLSKAGDTVAYDLWDPSLAQWDIYVSTTDGSTVTQLTNDSYEDSYPQLSWDGRRVVFTSRRDPGTGVTDMVVVRSATNPSAMEQVLPLPLGASDVFDPTFSPDGTKIVLEASGSNDIDGSFHGLVVMNADGTNAQLLTNPYATCDCWDGFPAFTSDGRQIVFTGVTNTGDASYVDVYIMNADGSSAPVQLTDGVGFNADPLVIRVPGMAETIIFESNRDNLNATATTGYELYSMNMDGSGLARLTMNDLFDGFTQEWFQAQGASANAKAVVRNRSGHRPELQSNARPPLHGFRFQ